MGQETQDLMMFSDLLNKKEDVIEEHIPENSYKSRKKGNMKDTIEEKYKNEWRERLLELNSNKHSQMNFGMNTLNPN